MSWDKNFNYRLKLISCPCVDTELHASTGQVDVHCNTTITLRFFDRKFGRCRDRNGIFVHPDIIVAILLYYTNTTLLVFKIIIQWQAEVW